MKAQVEIEVPSDEEILAILKQYSDAALEAADSAFQIIKDKAILDNQDVDGNQMPRKQPRPKNNPQNEPNFACLDTGDMLDKDKRTVVEITGDFERTLVYTPPDYFDFLITKDPEDGGRKWITYDKVNAEAMAEIQEEMQRLGDIAAS